MTTRVGWWYATGPADQKYYQGHPSFSLHTVVSDQSPIPGCVTVENPAGQQFPVANILIDEIAGPPDLDEPQIRLKIERISSIGGSTRGR